MSEPTELQLTPRGGDARCAYCHDPLADGAGVTCEGCTTRLHDDCVVEARCPTLGCEHLFAAPRAGAERPALPPRTTWRLVVSVALGVVLPLLCFGFNERGLARSEVLPAWQGEPGAFGKLVYAPQVHRYLYPLLAWAIAALVATFLRRRAPWISVGLSGGVVLAALFSAAYLFLLPVLVPGIIFFGIGLLGLGPFIALGTYARARWRYGLERPVTTEKDEAERPVDEGSTVTLWRVWTLLGAGGLAGAIYQMNVMFDRLPLEPPKRCFIASAAARGHARVVGAAPVRFANGQVVPVTRQLRALKAAELALAAFTPRLHRALRAVYDRAGPPVAARLGRTTGTLAWVLLLPAQALAELGLRLLLRDAGRTIARTYTDSRRPASRPRHP